jgi:hypothetical protein
MCTLHPLADTGLLLVFVLALVLCVFAPFTPSDATVSACLQLHVQYVKLLRLRSPWIDDDGPGPWHALPTR